MQMGGWKYRVLRRSKAAYQAEDGSYFDKLALDQVSAQDGGSYICLATNSVGYALRETALHVVSGSFGRFIHFVPLSNISPEFSRSKPSISRKSSIAVALHVRWVFIVSSVHL